MQGLFTAAALSAGDTLVRGNGRRLNRGAIATWTPRLCIKGYPTATVHKLTHPRGIKAASGTEEGLFSPLYSGREGSPNLQCKMQYLTTLLNVLAPDLAISSESTSLAFFYKKLHFEKEKVSS